METGASDPTGCGALACCCLAAWRSFSRSCFSAADIVSVLMTELAEGDPPRRVSERLERHRGDVERWRLQVARGGHDVRENRAGRCSRDVNVPASHQVLIMSHRIWLCFGAYMDAYVHT